MLIDQVGTIVAALIFTAGALWMAIALYVGGMCLWDAWVEWHRNWQTAREVRRQERIQAEAGTGVLKLRSGG